MVSERKSPREIRMATEKRQATQAAARKAAMERNSPETRQAKPKKANRRVPKLTATVEGVQHEAYIDGNGRVRIHPDVPNAEKKKTSSRPLTAAEQRASDIDLRNARANGRKIGATEELEQPGRSRYDASQLEEFGAYADAAAGELELIRESVNGNSELSTRLTKIAENLRRYSKDTPTPLGKMYFEAAIEMLKPLVEDGRAIHGEKISNELQTALKLILEAIEPIYKMAKAGHTSFQADSLLARK